MAFQSYGAPAVGGFLGGFTGMDKYLVDRRSTIRQQEFNNAVRQEMQTFGTDYYSAQQDPSRRDAFYNNHPLLTSNILRKGVGSRAGSRGTGGIFGSSGRTGAYNIYGDYYKSGLGKATTAPGSAKVISTGTGNGTVAGDVDNPAAPGSPEQQQASNPYGLYGISSGKNYNTSIDPYDFQVLQGADPLARPSLTPAENLTQDQFDPFSIGDLSALQGFNQVPYPRSDYVTPPVTQFLMDTGNFAAEKFKSFMAPDTPIGPVTQTPYVPANTPQPVDPFRVRLGIANANDATTFDPLTGLPTGISRR